MTSATNSSAIAANSEPIPGFRLEERIGIGGYGEVWRASAPGGGEKALKIIHGQIGEARAIREIRSLNRAMGLNHPFILALEQIEEANGQLIIVTELAEGTLADRYNGYREQGLPGVPREELIAYMREAADALDHLFENFALQHLDVKPDNLLMFGEHIKVADFGLMKDLQESCPSIVNSLTPRYASPEMFQGKPGPYSDQYSLAILYQEMVSGQLPFPGANIAALASQHLNCAPDLSSLSGLDRFAVGKALSKDPQSRFANCREFVERLSHRSSAMILTGAKANDLDRSNGRMGSSRPQPASPPGVHDGQTIQIAAPEIRSLPRLAAERKPPVYRPTLFVGLGGTGGKVLGRLRQLIADRIGEANAVRALRCLYIDTDADTLDKVGTSPWNEGLRDDEILITPLRQTKDYRSSPICQLDSISNRWVYNVPKSQRTQGLRALGRLALLDHSQRILSRLKDALLACTSHEAIAQSREESKLPFEENDPRVFVVSSIAGGTGGGMTIDMGYAVRQVLAECGFSDDEVCGILSYANGTGAHNCSFAPANAYSLFDELSYFSQAGCDYPGEHARGYAGFRETGPTFKSTYLFDLGDNLTTARYTEGIEQIAEYLYLNSVTPAMSIFDECRRLERENPSTEPIRLRTVGLYQFDAATREDPAIYAELLCRFLVRKWKVGLRSATDDEQIQLSDMERLYEACDPNHARDTYTPELVRHKLEELDLSLSSIAERVAELIRDQFDADPSEFLGTVIHDSLNAATDGASPVAVAARRLQAIMGCEGNHTSGDKSLVTLREHALPIARSMGEEWGKSLCDWVLQLVDTDFARVDGAKSAVGNVCEHISAMQKEASEQLEAARHRLAELRRLVSEAQSEEFPSRKSQRKPIASLLEEFAEALLQEIVSEAVAKTFNVLDPLVTSVADQVREMWKDLTQLTNVFQVPSIESIQTANGQPVSRLARLFAERKQDLIQTLDQTVESCFFSQVAPLREILSSGNHLRDDLPMRMRLLARQVILQACRQDSHSFMHEKLAGDNDAEFQRLIGTCIEKATPELLAVGGAKRLVVSSPENLANQAFEATVEQVASEEANFSYKEQADLLFCYEVEQVSWEGVRMRLIRQRHDCEELAKRLHTRINVDWTIV